MGSASSVQSSEPTNHTEFECSICAYDKEESVTIIDSAPVCRACVLDDIIPRFHAALQHEANYPVEWSASVTLKPQDFAEFFQEYDVFLKQWEVKEKEYNTAGKDRLYCACSSFLGERATSHERIHCPQCEHSVCGNCGSGELPHTCEAGVDDEDPFKDLADGSYQRCPNQTCSSMLCLADGCNDVRCRFCKTRFCWICKKSDPEHRHWNAGNPCPRFNQPGSANALFNEDVVEPEPEMDGGLRTLLTDAAILRNPPAVANRRASESILERWLKENDAVRDARILERSMHGIDFDTHPREVAIAARLLEENNRRFALEATPQGTTMIRHRELLDGMRQHALRRRDVLVVSRRALPAWLDPFLFVASQLLKNLDIYIYTVRVQAALLEYTQRHDEIMRFRNGASLEEIFELYPQFFIVLMTYKWVAPARFREAARELDDVK